MSFVDAISDDDVRPAIFYEGTFASGVVRLWSGLGERQWDGKTWQGAGTLLSISPIQQTDEVVATGCTITLSGVDPAVVSLALQDARQGLPGRVWLAFLDEAGEVIAAREEFGGRLDVPSKQDDADTCIVSISYESRLIDLNRARSLRWTDKTQRLFFPNDPGFDMVTTTAERQLVWGGQPATESNDAGTSNGFGSGSGLNSFTGWLNG